MLQMADGVRLATDVYLPAGAGPWPTILIRTPYGKHIDAPFGAEANADGYALVVQDMRGRYSSEGLNIPLIGTDLGQHSDGEETFAWVMQQPWCSGKIGTVGGSALGMTQNLTAPVQPPGLSCQFMGLVTSSMYHQFVYPGGAFREEQMVGWVDDAEFAPETLDLYYEHETYDDFWRQFSMEEHVAEINVPGVHFGGWLDTFSQGTIDSFVLRQHQGGVGARNRQWLIMGPWHHRKVEDTSCGDVTFPEEAARVPHPYHDANLDFWLKGEPSGMLEFPTVVYYVMGDVDDENAPGNEWRSADDWPIPATETPLYLAPDDALVLSAPEEAATSTWTFDPADPCPTLGGRNLYHPAGIYDQQALETRADVLVFSTEPLAAPLEVTGRVRCRLWVSCDAVDTDVAVRFCDVYPDGRSMLILDGILRLRYRDSMEQTELLIPGTIYEVEVDLWSTSYVFNAGHQIRLSVTGINYPRWDLNPGTGELWVNSAGYVVQETTLYYGADRPSAVLLPVVD
jgi:predicted acyl esterase